MAKRLTQPDDRSPFLRPILYLIGIAVAILFVWFQFEFLLLTISGILVAVWLRTLTAWIEHKTPLSCVISYLAVLVLVIGGTVLGCWLVVPSLISHLLQIGASLPSSIHRLEAPLLRISWGPQLIEKAHDLLGTASQDVDVRKMSANAVEWVAKVLVILIVGFFASLNPKGYEEGVLSLIPGSYRDRAIDVGRQLARQLGWWFLGQLCIMATLGVSCGISLWLLRVPLAGTLGLVTGLAVFLPYVGTVAAGIPSVLMGLQRSPHTAVWVLVVYSGLHVLEGYLLTPIVQQRAVRLPPVVTVLAQFLLWNLGGIIGVAIAAPLATVAIVLIKLLWLKIPVEEPIVVRERKPSCIA